MNRATSRIAATVGVASALVLGGLAAPASDRSPAPDVSDISGRYFFATFSHAPGATTGDEAASTAGFLDFDGAGRFTRRVEFDSRTGGAGSEGTGTYGLSPGGRLRIGSGTSFGLVALGTDLLVLPDLSPSAADEVGLLFAVRSHAPIQPIGRYDSVGWFHDIAIGGVDEFDVEAGYAEFDGAGAFVGRTEYPPYAVGEKPGTYDVLADGRLSFDGGPPYGLISADGEWMIVPTLRGDDRSLVLMVRRSAPAAVSDLVGRYYGVELEHDRPALEASEVEAFAGYLDLDGAGRYFARSTYADGIGPFDESGSGTYGVAADGRVFADDGPGFILAGANGGILVVPGFDPRSDERGVEVLARAPRFCDTGNVDLGVGEIADVLFVNGSNGGRHRTVSVALGQPIELALDAAPAGSGRGAYVVWGWSRIGDSCGDVIARGPQVIGCTVNPTPLTPAIGPQPVLCVYGAGVPAAACGSARSVAGPPGVPFTVRSRNGRSVPLTLLLQGVVQDRGAVNTRGFSVTNPIVLQVGGG